MPQVSTTPVVNLELRIFPRIFEKNSKRSQWDTVRLGGNWLMKKTRSKKSRDTVPLNLDWSKSIGAFLEDFSSYSCQTLHFYGAIFVKHVHILRTNIKDTKSLLKSIDILPAFYFFSYVRRGPRRSVCQCPKINFFCGRKGGNFGLKNRGKSARSFKGQ